MTSQRGTPRAVLFIRANRRVIGNKPDFDEHVQRQREAAQALAERLGATIEHEYVDRGGTIDLGRRSTLLTMLGDLLVGPPIDYVLTYDLARLSRRAEDWAAINDALITSGAALITTANGLTYDPEQVQRVLLGLAIRITDHAHRTKNEKGGIRHASPQHSAVAAA